MERIKRSPDGAEYKTNAQHWAGGGGVMEFMTGCLCTTCIWMLFLRPGHLGSPSAITAAHTCIHEYWIETTNHMLGILWSNSLIVCSGSKHSEPINCVQVCLSVLCNCTKPPDAINVGWLFLLSSRSPSVQKNEHLFTYWHYNSHSQRWGVPMYARILGSVQERTERKQC